MISEKSTIKALMETAKQVTNQNAKLKVNFTLDTDHGYCCCIFYDSEVVNSLYCTKKLSNIYKMLKEFDIKNYQIVTKEVTSIKEITHD